MADPTDKRSSGGEYGRVKYGASCMQGGRDEMQDAHTTILELDDGSDITSFFGVFDGRAGDKDASYCSSNFHIELGKHPDYDKNLPTAMRNVFSRMTEKLMERKDRMKYCSAGPQGEGIKACVALIRGKQITVATAGDIRCLLSRNGQAIDLSADQKPVDPGERARTKASGEQIPRQEIARNQGGQKVIGKGISRLDGKIGLSRALGDFECKLNRRLTLEQQKMTCNPDIRTENITDDIDFLLIASNSICHGKSSEQVAGYVNHYLRSGVTNLSTICEGLVDWCMASGDNSTVILVQFKSKPLDIIEDAWYEVLVRLPLKTILSSRSVCKEWHKISMEPDFLQRHHSLQEPQLLIVPMNKFPNRSSCEHSVLAINLQCPKDQFRPIISCTTFGKYKARDNEDEEACVMSAVHGSLDGMLLVSFDKTCYIINPAMRRSSRLLALDNAEKVLGFYRHASGQYIVLYQRSSEEEDGGDSEDENLEGGNSEEEELQSFCTIELGSHITRSVVSVTSKEYRRLHFAMDGQPPAVIGNRLYWAPTDLLDKVTVFDTESEVFHWMDPPTKSKTGSVIKLIELNGSLAASVSARGASTVELFQLVDSHSETWARHHVIKLPVAELESLWAGRYESFISLNGNIMVECLWQSLDDEKKSPGKLFCCSENGEPRLLFQGTWGASPVHVLKESLITTNFMSNTDPALFEGL